MRVLTANEMKVNVIAGGIYCPVPGPRPIITPQIVCPPNPCPKGKICIM